MLTTPRKFVKRACGGIATSPSRRLPRFGHQPVVEAVVAQLAVKRRAPDAERPRDGGHPSVMGLEREHDQFALEGGERGQLAAGGEEAILRPFLLLEGSNSAIDMNGR